MLSKKFIRIILVCVLQMFPVNSVFRNESSRIRHRRTLNFYFPYNSCYAKQLTSVTDCKKRCMKHVSYEVFYRTRCVANLGCASDWQSSRLLAVVMVLPLEDLPAGRSVFCSYNFETNFYYPYFDNTAGIVPLPFTWIDEPGANAGTKHRIDLPPAYRQFHDDDEAEKFESNDRKVEERVTEKNKTSDNNAKHRNVTNNSSKETTKASTKKPKNRVEKTKSREVRSLLNNYFMSRRRFYKLMESEMDRSGLNGCDCILKAICETSESPFGLNNGVVGSVIDVLFLPSTSKDEKLPKRYYRAETHGKAGNCNFYNKNCPKSVFDYISKIF